MDIYISDRQKDLELSSSPIKDLITAVIAFEARRTDEVSIHFVDQEEICALHKEFFNDPTPTDCISFPMDEEETMAHHVLGELIVCPQAALDYIEENGGDPYEETTLYVVHGLLHLMGYRDKTPEEQKDMRAAEKRHMDNLHSVGCLLTP